MDTVVCHICSVSLTRYGFRLLYRHWLTPIDSGCIFHVRIHVLAHLQVPTHVVCLMLHHVLIEIRSYNTILVNIITHWLIADHVSMEGYSVLFSIIFICKEFAAVSGTSLRRGENYIKLVPGTSDEQLRRTIWRNRFKLCALSGPIRKCDQAYCYLWKYWKLASAF